MRTRLGELVLVVAVIAVVFSVWGPWKASPPSPTPSPAARPPEPGSHSPEVEAGVYHPGPPPLAFNGVKVGDRIADLEARLGPPNFKNSEARYQQWEQPLTQMSYNEQGVVTEVGGSGTGTLTRGDVVLMRCGFAREADVIAVFGDPPAGPKDNFYTYPGLSVDDQGSTCDLIIHCGSESEGLRSVSHIQLGRPPRPDKPRRDGGV